MENGEMDAMKVEKMKAMKKFKRMRKVKKFLRYVIVASSAVLLSWSSVWIPLIVRTAILYFRFACSVVASPIFVFFLCNIIIVTLAAKSGQLNSGGSNGGSVDLYEEFVKNTENRSKYFVSGPDLDQTGDSEPALAETHENPCSEEPDLVEPTDKLPVSECVDDPVQTKRIVHEKRINVNPGKYARSQSENLRATERAAQPRARRLRRSETGIENSHRNSDNSDEKSGLIVMEVPPADSNETMMSNEELTQKVEAFIAKQWMQWRLSDDSCKRIDKKSLAMVVQSGN
eukprot:Gb_29550 [translate_table: standard]